MKSSTLTAPVQASSPEGARVSSLSSKQGNILSWVMSIAACSLLLISLEVGAASSCPQKTRNAIAEKCKSAETENSRQFENACPKNYSNIDSACDLRAGSVYSERLVQIRRECEAAFEACGQDADQAAEFEKFSEDTRQQTIEVNQQTAVEVTALSRENNDLDSIIAAAKRKKAAQREAERKAKEEADKAALEAAEQERLGKEAEAKQLAAERKNNSEDEQDTYGECGQAMQQLADVNKELKIFGAASNSRLYGALASQQVIAWATQKKIEIIEAHCLNGKGMPQQLAELKSAYKTALRNCEQLTAGGGSCHPMQPSEIEAQQDDAMRAKRHREEQARTQQQSTSNSSSQSSPSTPNSPQVSDDRPAGVRTAR